MIIIANFSKVDPQNNIAAEAKNIVFSSCLLLEGELITAMICILNCYLLGCLTSISASFVRIQALLLELSFALLMTLWSERLQVLHRRLLCVCWRYFVLFSFFFFPALAGSTDSKRTTMVKLSSLSKLCISIEVFLLFFVGNWNRPSRGGHRYAGLRYGLLQRSIYPPCYVCGHTFFRRVATGNLVLNHWYESFVICLGSRSLCNFACSESIPVAHLAN